MAALLAAPCTGLADEVYRWVDDQGRVHFGGTPPPSQKATKWEGGNKRETSNVMPDAGTVHKRKSSGRISPYQTGMPVRTLPRRTPQTVDGPSRYAGQIEALEQRIALLEKQIAETEDGNDFMEKRYRNGIRVGYDNKESKIHRLQAQLDRAENELDRLEAAARD